MFLLIWMMRAKVHWRVSLCPKRGRLLLNGRSLQANPSQRKRTADLMKQLEEERKKRAAMVSSDVTANNDIANTSAITLAIC